MARGAYSDAVSNRDESTGGGCIWCAQPVGTPHKLRCVAVWGRNARAWWAIAAVVIAINYVVHTVWLGG